MAEPALAIDALTVTLHRNARPVRVLDGLDLEVAAGEILALVGESGSGKSTLGMALQGLLPPEAEAVVTGSMCIAGQQVTKLSRGELRELRRTVVRSIPQDPMANLNPTMTIGRQLSEPAARADMLDWLGRVGLDDPARVAAAYPHRLSGGQRQRVLIAMAMMSRPRLLVADEPTTALDVTTQAQILELLRQLARERGTAILFITHDLGVAATLADRVAVLHRGRIVEAAPTRVLVTSPRHDHTRFLLAARFDMTTQRAAATNRSSSTGAPVLEFRGVAKSYPTGRRRLLGGRAGRSVLKSVDLSIRAGECVALVGESGAGKSTVLRIAAGLVRPDSGGVTLGMGRPQVVFQDPAASLTPWLSVGEQVGDRVARRSDRQSRVRDVFELVGFDPALSRALPGELSIGQCQRAALACALVVPPALLLCDEPISALDMPLAASILELLGTLRRRLGMAMLFVTHDLAAARLVADRIAVLKDGEILEEIDADDLLVSPGTAYTRALLAAVPAMACAP